MGIHEKITVGTKAGLSEIFAALSGITCAGVTLSKQGVDTKKDALTDTAVRAAYKSIDMKYELAGSPKAATQEKLAKDALAFLNAAASVMAWYQDIPLSHPDGKQGKNVRDVLTHIENMLEREKYALGDRPVERLAKDGVFVGVVHADYLPGEEKKASMERGARSKMSYSNRRSYKEEPSAALT